MILAEAVDNLEVATPYLEPLITVVGAWGASLIGLLIWMVKQGRTAKFEAIRSAKVTDEKVENAAAAQNESVKVILRQLMTSQHRSVVKRGEMSIREKKAYIDMHNAYIGMGGNGYASHMLEDLSNINLVTDDGDTVRRP